MPVVADACSRLPRRVCIANGFNVLLAAAMLLPTAGCGKVDNGDRQPLSGTVTIQGEPVTGNGTIFFSPQKGQEGAGCAAEVSGGKFEIPVEAGPTPGLKFNVTMVMMRDAASTETKGGQSTGSERYVAQVEIPPRDALVTEMTIDFKARNK